ncbi:MULTISPECIES: acyl-CoA synthetase [Burkholderia]|jgi:fatty-acyl-CoA synthase|uniref:Acyl-CoA synthetase n=8 Tax=Burkholderia contaminans TaxID=488447 RepID=A0A1E3FLZ7_9BURK|nr:MULTISPECIES: acyl-CoA synthetase [Burkholderia]KKL42247.1 AMP-binding protein [Burkholderia contaminans LMG 23361]MBA9829004.1 acyl-CoA synthetase [Burkholderia contaminans]MBA9838099.1 acyl-CoA synthetase [Burkholderia contaminans]MBA9862422.1 acyl-CoA synthetase [Burkholderia contaminans]MBA9907390.1 acyl-CoA synthetase [Burkholderia contaminans]
MNGIATQDDVLAIEAQGLPPALPASTYEMICAGAAIDPSAPALSFFPTADAHRDAERWTYRELVRDITRTANMFTRIGVRANSVIAYVLPNLPETHFVIWGGQAAGIVCAINPLLEGEAIAKLLEAAGASVLVTLAPFPGIDLWQKVATIVDRVESLRHLVLVDPADRLRGRTVPPAPRTGERDDGGLRAAVPAHIEIHDFGTAIARESGDALDHPRRARPDDMSSFFCTGGTTGLPKIAMRSHGNEVANAWSASRFLGDSIGPGKTTFCGLPLFHVNAAMVTGLLPFSRGAHVVLGTPQGYRGDGVVKRFWEIVEHHRINFFSGVPTLYASLLDVPVDGHAIDSLEYGLCGAAPMPVGVFKAFQEKTGIRILEGYGLTEGTCVSSVNPPTGERRLGSIGLRLPFQAMKTIVVDEAGRYVRDCAANEAGLLVIAGPNVFSGYLRADQNNGLWPDLGDGRRWLNTGDLGRCDADGYFWLTGRKKELIIRGGHNIDPASIEEPLHRHPAVQVAAAVGRPDAHAGELPVAYVQLKPGMHATEDDLAAFMQQEIAERAAVPKHVRIVAAIPLTGVGKIFKPELKRRETRDALQAALAQAGAPCTSLDVNTDDAGRMSVAVALSDPALEAAARSVLGRFPFAFSISIAAHPMRPA